MEYRINLVGHHSFAVIEHDLYGHRYQCQQLLRHCINNHYGFFVAPGLHFGYGNFGNCRQRRNHMQRCIRHTHSFRRNRLYMEYRLNLNGHNGFTVIKHNLYGYGYKRQQLYCGCLANHYGGRLACGICFFNRNIGSGQ